MSILCNILICVVKQDVYVPPRVVFANCLEHIIQKKCVGPVMLLQTLYICIEFYVKMRPNLQIMHTKIIVPTSR
jgi:hypothetical protein